MTRVYQQLAGALAEAGTETIFCVLGDGNLDLLVEIAERHGVVLVHARHEQGAVAMADGYARRTRAIGVAAVTHGPGLTQTATSLKVAAARRSAVLLLAGDTPTGDPHHIQSFDQAPFVAALGVTAVPLRSAATWRRDLDEALQGVRSGPVVFNLPTDYQLAACQPAAAAPPPAPPLASSVAVGTDRAAEGLRRAAAPVIVAGRGAIGAEPQLAELAARLGSPVVTTLGSRGLLHGHPAHLGFIGGLGHSAAVQAVESADWLCVVGASLNAWSTKGGAMIAGKRLIRLDSDRRALVTPVAPDVALLGDAGPTLTALLADLASHDHVAVPGAVHGGVVDDDDDLRDGVDCVDPRRALVAIEAALPAERTIVMDGGHFITFACTALSASSPERFIVSCDFATIGQGLASAIGASVATPAERTTLIVGDGGFLMGVAELDTAVRYALPLNVVVLNDGAYGQEVHSLAAKGKPAHHAVFDVPDLGALARGFGADGHRLRSDGDLGHLSQLLRAPGGPRVIDVRVNPEVVSPATREIFRQVRHGVEPQEADRAPLATARAPSAI